MATCPRTFDGLSQRIHRRLQRRLSIIYEEHDSYRGTKSRQVLFMGEEDMGRLGPAAGMTIDLTSPHGHMKGLTLHAFELPPGNLMAYYAEANVLMGRESDPRSKMPAFQSLPVAIPKAS